MREGSTHLCVSCREHSMKERESLCSRRSCTGNFQQVRNAEVGWGGFCAACRHVWVLPNGGSLQTARTVVSRHLLGTHRLQCRSPANGRQRRHRCRRLPGSLPQPCRTLHRCCQGQTEAYAVRLRPRHLPPRSDRGTWHAKQAVDSSDRRLGTHPCTQCDEGMSEMYVEAADCGVPML